MEKLWRDWPRCTKPVSFRALERYDRAVSLCAEDVELLSNFAIALSDEWRT